MQLRTHGHQVVTTDIVGEVDIAGDLGDSAFCERLPAVDAVVHCAAVQYVSKNLPILGRSSYFHRNNVVATANLTVRYSRSKVHFVNIGTSMMYRQSGLEIYGVNSPMGGQGVYSESKVAAQQSLRSLPGPTLTVIPCIIAGRGREGLFRPFVKTMTELHTVIIPGKGIHKIHMVHVTDVASLIALAVQKGATGMLNAAGPSPLSITEWVDEIEEELGMGRVRRIHLPLAPLAAVSRLMQYIPLAREQLLMLKYAHVLDVAESCALGWHPKFTNADIVRDTARALAPPQHRT